MRLTRIHLDCALAPGELLELPAESAAHVAKVLRARSGDELVLFNGDGREFTGEVASVRGSRVTVAVGRGAPVDRESPLDLTLLQCVPRGDRMDFIVQKATELGVRRIVPLQSERSVVRLDASQAATKLAHWRAVAVGACEQCGRNRLPQIDAPRRLIDHLGEAAPHGAAWVLEPGAAAHAGRALPDGAAQIAVGPEGGFSGEELEAFRIAKFTRLGLGPRILRTETAAIAVLAVLQARFGDFE